MFLSQKEDIDHGEPAIIKLEDPEESPKHESDIINIGPKKSPSIIPDEIFDKFNKSQMDSSSYSPNKKNIGGTTEQFPMSDEYR